MTEETVICWRCKLEAPASEIKSHYIRFLPNGEWLCLHLHTMHDSLVPA